MSDIGPIESVDTEIDGLDPRDPLSTSRDEAEKKDHSPDVSSARLDSKPIDHATERDLATPTSRKGRPSRAQNLRYKNPIMATFAVMALARKTMQKVAKNTKDETRRVKKHWEEIAHQNSGYSKQAIKDIEAVQKREVMARF